MVSSISIMLPCASLYIYAMTVKENFHLKAFFTVMNALLRTKGRR